MYADTEQPLKVSGDNSGIVVKVMEKAGDSDEDRADSEESPKMDY
jgi:hypothetical protein